MIGLKHYELNPSNDTLKAHLHKQRRFDLDKAIAKIYTVGCINLYKNCLIRRKDDKLDVVRNTLVEFIQVHG